MDVIDHVSSFHVIDQRSCLTGAYSGKGCLQGLVWEIEAPGHRLLTQYPGGFLRILSEGDDGWIFLVLKYSIPGFFLGKEMWQVFFGWLRPSPHIYAVFD